MENALITSMDIPPASHEMWLSDAEGWVTHLDLREDKSKRRAYQLSDRKIGCLSVNPTNPAFILTASNNRTLKYAVFFFGPPPRPARSGSTLISLCGCDQGLGCTETPKASGASIVAFFHWSPMLMISVLTRASRSNAMAFLSSGSRTSSSSTSQKGARQRSVRIVNMTKLSLRHLGTHAGGRW
jgi:hypothetical protein